MAHEYTEWQPDAEPQASSARGGGPPSKITGIGILDPPPPPTGPVSSPIAPLLGKVFALVILIGIVVATFLVLTAHR